MTKYSLPVTAISVSLRKLMFAGFAGSLIALASTSQVLAGDAATQDARASAVSIATAPAAETVVSREYLIKAAIVYNFTKFAEWPAAAFDGPGAPLRICVLGEDPFGPALDALRGKTVRDRVLTASRVTDLDNAGQCHVLFVSASEQSRLPQILAALATQPVLTVADMGRFTDFGGIIALKETDHRSRIEVNLGAARQAGVTLSSKLLRLADNPNASVRSDSRAGSGGNGAI